MRVVLIGDIGWRYLYHLGDEAMTEAAVDALKARGVHDITLVAGEPEVSKAFYGLPSVGRVGFKSTWDRARNSAHLAAVSRALESGDVPKHSIFSAIHDADALIIAGGGNMNSSHYHLLYERLAAKRIAQHFGVPLLVTSQTVGPLLRPSDFEKVKEIAEYATCFGARELATYELVRSLVAQPNSVCHTMDDAILLQANQHTRTSIGDLNLPDRYVVASFTNHHGTVWSDANTYFGEIATLCDTIAAQHDAQVILTPHAGSLDSGRSTRDQESNARILAHTRSGRIHAVRQVTAREDVAMIERSILSLSTRYHPTVFGPAANVPTAAIASSYYSSVRMRGSMRNVGLQRFIIPTVATHLAADAISELIDGADRVSSHMARANVAVRNFQNSWWDAVVQAIETGHWITPGNLPVIDEYVPEGQWTGENEAITRVSDLYTRTLEDKRWVAEDLAAAKRTTAKLKDTVAQTRSELEAVRTAYDGLKSRRAIKVANTVGRFRRRVLRRGSQGHPSPTE